MIKTATNTLVGTATTGGLSPYGVAVIPAGGHVHVTNPLDGTVTVLDVATKM